MKQNIYTLPLIDAFAEHGECPFCSIERKLEQEAVSFAMGPSYMEDDIREKTDQLGFCRHHYKMMYDYGNALGVAIILDTYYQKMNKELAEQIKAFQPQKSGFFKRMKPVANDIYAKDAQTSLGQWIQRREETCYVCDHFYSKYARYLDTFLEMVMHDPDFHKTFLESKGFCLHHFRDILEAAEVKLSEKQKSEFYPQLFELMQTNLQRLAGDVSWFIDKHDYRYKDADWKDSRDANPRAIQKIIGGFPADPPFKKK